MEHFKPSDVPVRSDPKSPGILWHVQVGEKSAANAAFTFRNSPANGPKLEDYIAFEWKKMDAWFEEDEEVLSMHGTLTKELM